MARLPGLCPHAGGVHSHRHLLPNDGRQAEHHGRVSARRRIDEHLSRGFQFDGQLHVGHYVVGRQLGDLHARCDVCVDQLELHHWNAHSGVCFPACFL